MTKPLDLITIGRSSVDLYGAQIGGRLEDMRSFEKYIGGSPTNIACGTARLGLKSAVITGVGDEHMGRFIVEQLQREGVDIRGVKTDPDRLTALVLLGIRDEEQFPLIFYRENCADMGLTEDDIDPAFIAEARAVVATGTHLSHPRTEAAVLKALRLARENGAQTALDIDYRPNLWGVAGHGEGESRFVASDKVTAKLQATLHHFDLIVGTEEEFHIAGGTTDTLAALRAVREVSAATLVCKRGAAGAVAFTGAIPDSLDDGEAGPGFPIEVFNVLGAGDGFMSGLLKGWLDSKTGRGLADRAQVRQRLRRLRRLPPRLHPRLSRPGPSSSSSSTAASPAPTCATTPSSSRCTGRPTAPATGPRCASSPSTTACRWRRWRARRPTRSAPSRSSASMPATRVADGRPGYGILCDGRLGREALYRAAGTGLWIGRPVEWPGSRPLTLEPEIGPDCGGLSEWPADHVVKCLCFCHPDDDAATWADQIATVSRLFAAARRNRLEFLLEVIPSKVGPVDDDTTATIIQRFYDAGIYPDWWKLEPFRTDAAWARACAAINRNDPNTRGVVVLGLDAPAARAAGQLRPRRAARSGPGLRRRPHDLRRRRAAPGWRARSTTRPRWPTWREKFASLADTWNRARAEGREQAA